MYQLDLKASDTGRTTVYSFPMRARNIPLAKLEARATALDVIQTHTCDDEEPLPGTLLSWTISDANTGLVLCTGALPLEAV